MPSYVYPINLQPPPGFAPRSEADVIGVESWARVVAWEAKQWSYLADCALHGPAYSPAAPPFPRARSPKGRRPRKT
jgi:hypothetical protein